MGYSDLTLNLISVAIYFVLFAIPIAGWIRWFKQSGERSVFATLSAAGLGLASLSILLAILGFICSFFHPVSRELIAIGFLSALPAVLLSICGVWHKNPVRWHALAASLLILVLWVAAGVSE